MNFCAITDSLTEDRMKKAIAILIMIFTLIFTRSTVEVVFRGLLVCILYSTMIQFYCKAFRECINICSQLESFNGFKYM